jgi:hypothetical protein
MHLLAIAVFGAFHQSLAALLATLMLGAAITAANEYFTNDTERYLLTAALNDTALTLTFKNTDFLVSPDVILTPLGAGTYANSVCVTGRTATNCTISMTTGVGAMTAALTIRRRR